MSETQHPCPACETVSLEPVEDHGVPFLGCQGCRGAFISVAHMTAYVEAATDDRDASATFLSLLKEGLQEDEPDGAQLRDCPMCQKPLQRFGFGEHPLVIADRCAEHGLWLDRRDVPKVVRSCRAVAMVEDAEPEADEVGMIDVDDEAMACPNCGKRFPGAAPDDRCTDCNVILYQP